MHCCGTMSVLAFFKGKFMKLVYKIQITESQGVCLTVIDLRCLNSIFIQY